MTNKKVLLVAALILFLLSMLGVSGPFNLVAAGLACCVGALLLEQ